MLPHPKAFFSPRTQEVSEVMVWVAGRTSAIQFPECPLNIQGAYNTVRPRGYHMDKNKITDYLNQTVELSNFGDAHGHYLPRQYLVRVM